MSRKLRAAVRAAPRASHATTCCPHHMATHQPLPTTNTVTAATHTTQLAWKGEFKLIKVKEADIGKHITRKSCPVHTALTNHGHTDAQPHTGIQEVNKEVDGLYMHMTMTVYVFLKVIIPPT